MYKLLSHKVLVILLFVTTFLACSDSDSYDPALCDNILKEINNCRNITDISDKQWQQLFDQYLAASRELDSRINKLMDTPWSDQKAADIDSLGNSKLVDHWLKLSQLASAARHPELVNPALVPDGFIQLTDSLSKRNSLYLRYLRDVDFIEEVKTR